MTPEERAEVERQLEEGTVATLLINPALAVAGGLLGGIAVSVLAWRAAWRDAERRHALALSRRLRRNLAGRP